MVRVTGIASIMHPFQMLANLRSYLSSNVIRPIPVVIGA